MARTPKPKAAVINNELLASLRQLDQIEPVIGQQYENHVLLKDNWAMVYNGVIAAGEKIAEDFTSCPHIELMIEALSKCGQSIAFTQLDNNRLSIKSEKFKALVPCLDPVDFPLSMIAPDSPSASISDALRGAILGVSCLADESQTDILAASLLIDRGSVIATDRKVIVETWHGIDLPPMLALPKAIIAPIIKNTKKLKSFGYSKSSCTFWYEDDSWIRTQFFADKWPEVRPILDSKCNLWPIPEDFWKAIRALEKFSDDGNIYFDMGKLCSHADDREGATYEVYGIPKGPVISIKQLKMIEPLAKTIDFLATGPNGNSLTIWYGDACRGAIAGRQRA